MSSLLAIAFAVVGILSIVYHNKINNYVVKRLDEYWGPKTRLLFKKDFKVPRWFVRVNAWGPVFAGVVLLLIAYTLVFGTIRIK